VSGAPIFLLRHGETEWNAIGRIQGRLDSPLTALGCRQAAAVGAALRAQLDGAAIELRSSPLGRARQTASIVAATLGLADADIGTDERLREMSWGRWDGMTHAEIEAAAPGTIAARHADHWAHVPPEGESYAMGAARIAGLLDELRERTQPIVLVSHGAVSRVIRGLFAALPPAAIVALPEPQDAYHRLAAGGIEVIRVTVPPA